MTADRYVGQTKVASGVIFHYVGETRDVESIYYSFDELKEISHDGKENTPEMDQAIQELK
jgi:hypothetical protein